MRGGILVIDPDFIDWNFPNEILREIKNLKSVCLATTTDSYVDVEYLKGKNIPVYTISNYSTQSVAEYLVMLMNCVAKKIPLQLKNKNKQDFSDEYLQFDLKDKKVGIVGLGHIGLKVCEICNGIGMNVSFWDRKKKNSKFSQISLEEIFTQSDVIFITLSINSETKKLIGDKLLKSMKQNSILISGTGFELVNEKTVRELLKENKIYGFGAEIPNLELKDIEGNAMITSEYAWFTNEATQRRKQMLAENILKCKLSS